MPSVWKLAAGQVTLFSSPGSPPKFTALEVYQAIWKDDPDNFQRQPAVLGPTVANGRRKNAMVGCTVQPLRVDIVLNPVQTAQIRPDSSLPVFGSANEVRGEFESVFNAIAAGGVKGSYNRIAVRMQFRAQASNHTEANTVLAASLPDRYRLHLSDEEDVVLQVNSPYRDEATGNLKVNRLTRWSVETVQVLTFAVPIAPTQAAPEGPQVATFTTATLSFEENNVPSKTPLSDAQLAHLGREGIKHATEAGREFGFQI
jgi:hypothetical protein